MDNNNNNNHGAKTIITTTALPDEAAPIRNIFLVAAIAAGVQFGWALQLSLLTPYVQLLGIPHKWASYIWLCGPISGMIVQPVVGYFSDNCTSRFGRRRPFIAAGAGLVGVAVVLIGFAADLGHAGGDSLGAGLKPRAIGVFVFGFWILDVANNMLQGPCRALLADLSGGNTKKMANANSFFSFFMAVGNVLGYAAGSYSRMYKVFPFSKTIACDIYCANLKSCFIISITLLITLTTLALSIVREKRHIAEEQVTAAKKGFKIPVFPELFGALKHLPRPMWVLLLVTALNWIAWFGFLLFDTDWMGREVYGGNPSIDVHHPELAVIYNKGVSAGALGLMLNSIVLGFASLGVQYMARALGGVKRLWGIVNFILAICLCMTIVITKVAEHNRSYSNGMLQTPESSVKIGALVVFSALGIPLAITFSVPFALASIYSNSTGSGQGLSLGVLNLAIVIPQMIVSIASGPWDAMFGGGNLPAFVVGAVAAAASGIFAFTMLPSPPADSIKNLSVAGGH